MSEWDEFWTRTEWRHAELNDKTVEFTLTGPEWQVSGKGTFQVSERPNGEQLIRIIVPVARRGE